MRIAKGLWFMVMLFFVGVMAGCVWLLTTQYEHVIHEAISQLKRPDLEAALRNKYFTINKFQALQRIAYFGIALCLALLSIFIWKRRKIISSLNQLQRTTVLGIKGIYKEISSSSITTKVILGLLMSIVCIRSMYYAYSVYPQYDECWNYNYFLSNHFFTSFFAYNNYPLHNILTYITLGLLPDNTFCMRLPNIIIGTINMLLVFVVVKKMFKDTNLSLAASALFAVLPTVVFYFLFARGVMLALFFAILLFYYFFVKGITKWSRPDTVIVAILGGLGSFSMISFPILIGVLFILFSVQSLHQKDVRMFKRLLLPAVGIGVISLILYAPILMGSGVDIALHSGYLNNETSIMNSAKLISKNQIGFYHGAYLFIAINLGLLFVHHRKRLIVFNLMLLLLPFVLPFILGHLPARALSFQALAYLFTVCLLFEYILPFKRIFVPVVSILVLFFNYHATHHTFFDWSSRKDKGTYDMAQVLIKKDVHTIYDLEGHFFYFIPGLQYHCKLAGKELRCYTANKSSSRYLPNEKYTGAYYVSDLRIAPSPSIENPLFEYHDESNHFVLYEK